MKGSPEINLNGFWISGERWGGVRARRLKPTLFPVVSLSTSHGPKPSCPTWAFPPAPRHSPALPTRASRPSTSLQRLPGGQQENFTWSKEGHWLRLPRRTNASLLHARKAPQWQGTMINVSGWRALHSAARCPSTLALKVCP